MSQLTREMVERWLVRTDPDGMNQHIDSTVWEEHQLVRAWLNLHALPQRPEGAAVAAVTVTKTDKWHGCYTTKYSPEHWEHSLPFGDTKLYAESPPASAVAEPVANGEPWKSMLRQAEDDLAKLRATTAQAATVSDDLRDTIENVLLRYRAQHSVDEDGASLPLMDLLSPNGSTVAVGKEEIHLIADSIADALASSPAAPAPVIPESAICHCTCHNDPLYCHSCDDCDCHKENDHG